eukprot:TRINITY_DN3459_c0_g1_i1.p1 TRINITY_DN3459_c0_g1~~TRINITY_DN3459_c0_g1_i1.p1  ORF type:complete len:264 (-),score=35.60 TRINITY_DN3459_c0_g1_i1:60-851(-)
MKRERTGKKENKNNKKIELEMSLGNKTIDPIVNRERELGFEFDENPISDNKNYEDNSVEQMNQLLRENEILKREIEMMKDLNKRNEDRQDINQISTSKYFDYIFISIPKAFQSFMRIKDESMYVHLSFNKDLDVNTTKKYKFFLPQNILLQDVSRNFSPYFGYMTNELINKSISLIIPNYSRTKMKSFANTLDSICVDKTNYLYIIMYVKTKKGYFFKLDLSASVICSDEGIPISSFCFCNKISPCELEDPNNLMPIFQKFEN